MESPHAPLDRRRDDITRPHMDSRSVTLPVALVCAHLAAYGSAMTNHRPTACPECRSDLRIIRQDATESYGYSKPSRVDWWFQCTASAAHEQDVWIEYP